MPTHGADSAEVELQAQLQEAVLAKKAAEDRCLELKAAVSRTQKELDKVNQKLADALADNQQLRTDLSGMRIKAANVLVNYDDLQPATLLTQLQGDLRRLQQTHEQINRSLTDYKRALDSVLDILDPKQNAALRQMLNDKLALVFSQLADAENLVTIETPTNGTGNHLEAQVLTTNDELNVVILDAGTAQGMRVGSTWAVTTSTGVTTTVRIVETRHSLSAAMVVGGRIREIVPGATARLVIAKPSLADQTQLTK